MVILPRVSLLEYLGLVQATSSSLRRTRNLEHETGIRGAELVAVRVYVDTWIAGFYKHQVVAGKLVAPWVLNGERVGSDQVCSVEIGSFLKCVAPSVSLPSLGFSFLQHLNLYISRTEPPYVLRIMPITPLTEAMHVIHSIGCRVAANYSRCLADGNGPVIGQLDSAPFPGAWSFGRVCTKVLQTSVRETE